MASAENKIDYRPRKRPYQDENGNIRNARGKHPVIQNTRGPDDQKGSFYTPHKGAN